MTNHDFDQKMKESLIKHSHYPADIKNTIWNKIDEELEQIAPKPLQRKRTKQPMKKWIGFSITAASIVFIFSFISTESGNALINQVKQLFVPEKTVVEEIEGTKEETDVTLTEGSTDYVIYIDQERYKMIKVEGKDRIVLKEPLEERYPDVFMEIYEVNTAPEEAVQNLYNDFITDNYPKISDIQQLEKPLPSFMTYAIGGTGGYEWNDPIIKYYVFSNQNGGSFVIKQKYFLEAAEGHGARFEQMLQQFHIVDRSLNNES